MTPSRGLGTAEREQPEAALIVLIGVAGAGKSTFAAARWRCRQVFSLDEIREWVSDDDCDQDATSDAVAMLHALLAARMQRRLTTVVDATNLTPGSRGPLVALARTHGMPAVAVVIETPLPVCHARNAARPGPRGSARWGRRVPANLVDAQHRQLRAFLPGLRSEGFAEVQIHPQPATSPDRRHGDR
jgi:predicted kinase